MKKKINKKLLLLSFLIFSFSFLCFKLITNAEVVSLRDNDIFVYYGNNYSYPYRFNINGNVTKDETIHLINNLGVTYPYTYLFGSVCTNGGLEMSVYNNNYNYFFDENTFKFYDAHMPCKSNNSDGYLFYFQLQVGKYRDYDGTGEELEASSHLLIKNTYSWNSFYSLGNFYLSSDDIISSMMSDENLSRQFANIENGLTSMTTGINNINNMIGSTNSKLDGVNSKLDGVGNKINDTNNKLDDINNQDINSSDKELPDDSKYQNYENKENELRGIINQADTSVVDISLDSNTNSFIWDSVVNFINTNTLVYGFYITILSIGVVKLVLGR